VCFANFGMRERSNAESRRFTCRNAQNDSAPGFTRMCHSEERGDEESACECPANRKNCESAKQMLRFIQQLRVRDIGVSAIRTAL
jgi:hypothetical protein